MKSILGICILVGFYSTAAVAQQKKTHNTVLPKGHHSRMHAGNNAGEFTRRETSTIRRVEKSARRAERKAEKERLANNDRRRTDAKRAEKATARKTSQLHTRHS